MTTQFTKSFFALALFCGLSIVINAQTFTSENIKYEVTPSSPNEVEVSGVTSTSISGEIVIPSTINGYTVTAIGFSAFKGCHDLTSVTIPNSVTEIESFAFCDCGLTSVTIPNSVTEIGSNAFASCSRLTSVTIGNAVTTIGEGAFSYCTGLTKIYVKKASPPTVQPNTFKNVPATIPVYVPCESAPDYSGWSSFTNIIADVPLYTVTVANSNITMGTAAVTQPNTCNNNVATIEATANAGYIFMQWHDGNTDNPRTVTVTSDTSFTAEFIGITGDCYWTLTGDAPDLTLTIIPNGGGAMGNYTSDASVPWSSYRNNIKTLNIQEGVTTVGDWDFCDCIGLTSVTIPNSVTSIGIYAFGYCSGLISVTIPNSVTTIGSAAFTVCSNLTSLTIGNSVTTIGSLAFHKCTGLTSVTIPNSVISIGEQAFHRCVGLTSVIIGNSVTTIGGLAFSECFGLTSVTIPNSVTAIEEAVFSYCTGLTGTLTIPNSVTSIGNYAFENCSGLTSVTIPNSVTTIGNSAFYGCSGLTSVINLSLIPQAINSNVFTGVTLNSCSLTVATSSLSAYRNAAVWQDFAPFVAGGTLLSAKAKHPLLGSVSSNPPSGLYTGNPSVTLTATIPEDYSFWGWTSGETLLSNENPFTFTLTQDAVIVGDFGKPASIIDLAAGTLHTQQDVKTITHLTLTGNIDARDIQFMRDSMPLLSILDLSGATIVAYTGTEGTRYGSGYTYPANEIPQYSFYHNSLEIGKVGLTSVTMPTSATSIGNFAFYYCSGLTGTLTIPDAVTSIGDRALGFCSGLTDTLTIPNSVTTIGERTFYACVSLPSVTIPNSVTAIGAYAFSHCISLTSVTIPNLVTTIGERTFFYCTGLTSVTIGNLVTTIGDAAFCYCNGLTEIYVKAANSPVAPGSHTFTDVNKTIPVHVPCGRASAYQGWSGFTNIIEDVPLYDITTESSNITMGTALVTQPNTCENDEAIIVATPNTGYHFVQWQDGVTDSLRRVTVISDTSFTATFEINTYSVSLSVNNATMGSVSGDGSYAFNTEATIAATPNTGYHFMQWHDGNTDNPRTVTVTSDTSFTAEFAGITGDCFWTLTGAAPNLTLTIIAAGNGAMDDYTVGTAPWYSYQSGIKTLNIQQGVTTIGGSAFSSCSRLTEVTIPNSVTTIGYAAFHSCSRLTEVTIPNSVTSIEDYAFYYCSGLAEVTIPNSVTTIGNFAFEGCDLISINVDESNPNYSSIDGVLFNKSQDILILYPAAKTGSYTIPNSVTTIENSAFLTCSSLTEVTIPNSVITIGDYAFSNCSVLTSATIPNSVTAIGTAAFRKCSGLTSLTIGNSVTTIEDYVFYACRGLTSLTIGNSVTTIGEGAFCGCSSLTSVTIPNSVTSIGSIAFDGCRGLTSLTIGNSVTTIGTAAFASSSALTEIYVKALSPPVVESNAFANMTATIHVPCGRESAYQGWGGFANIIEDPLFNITIASNDTDTDMGRAAVTQPNTCTSNEAKIAATPNTGYHFVQWNDGVTDNPRTVTVTSDTAFTAEFKAYTNIDLATAGTLKEKAGVKSISSLRLTGNIDARDVQFMRDSMPLLSILDLSGATIVAYEGTEGTFFSGSDYIYPANQMPMYSFYHNSLRTGKVNLISVTMPTSVTSIGTAAFFSCSGLTSATIPNSVTSIESSAFSGCSGLTGTLTIPNSVTTIEREAFKNCSGLTGTLTIPNLVTSLESYTFQNCSNLTEVTIGNAVTMIGYAAFSNCSSLTEITISNSVTTIENSAFSSCTGLTSVINLSLIPQAINSSVFSDVSINNCSLRVATSSLSAYQEAEVWQDFAPIVAGGTLLSAKAKNPLQGSVSSNPPNGLYPENRSVTLTATFPEDYGFLGWTSGENKISNENPFTFTLTKDTVIVGDFGKTASIIDLAAGTLAEQDIKTITHLTLTGNIDARDIQFMRDSMPFLSVLDLSGATIVAYTGREGTYYSDYDITYPANEMPEYSFYHNLLETGKISLTSVIMPNSVTSIGDRAFYHCSGLTGTLTIPNSVTSIGNYAFFHCSGLTGTLTIPNSVTSIGNSAFFYCRGLTGTLTIPNSVTSIGNSAFYYCSNLTEVTIGNAVTTIGYATFSICSSLTEVTIPNSVTTIENYAFDGCSRLTSVTIGNAVTTIEEGAFRDCTGLTKIYVKAATPPTIGGDNTFYNVPTTTVFVYVPCGKKSVYSSTSRWNSFSSNNIIEDPFATVTVASSNTIMGTVAITQPNTCESNEAKIAATPNTGYHFVQWNDGETDNPRTVTVTSDTSFTATFEINTYSVSLSVNNATMGSVSGGGSYAFNTEATIAATPNTGYHFMQWHDGNTDNPRTVTVTSDTSFTAEFIGITGDCYWTLTGTAPDLTLTIIAAGNGAMGNYTSHLSVPWASYRNDIKTLNIQEGVTTIGNYAFSNCSGLTSVTIPELITTIGVAAFASCTGLTGTLTIPNSVTSIGNSAFRSCTGLTGTLTIPNSVTSIGNDAFASCSGLTGTLTIPNSVTTIGSFAFSACSGLTGTLTIPNLVATIGSAAFSYCSGLTSVTIGNSVTSIGNDAFASCTGLTSVTIGNSVTSIQSYAFEDCSGLTKIYVKAITPPAVGTDAFNNVTPTIPVYVPCGAASAYQNWGGFSNIIADIPLYTVTVASNHTDMGTAAVTTPNTCASDVATITAMPKEGYLFVEWNDGNTSNPRIVTVTSDISFTATFRCTNATDVDYTTNPPALGHSLSLCSGDVVTLAVDAPNQLTIATLNESATFTFSGDGNLSATFKISVNGTALTKSEYESLGFPTIGWNGSSSTLTYPITQITGTSYTLTLPAVASAITYKFQLVSIQSDFGTCPPTAAGANDYVDITVNPLPAVTVTPPTTGLTLCEGAVLSFAVTNKNVVMNAGTESINFAFTGEDPAAIMMHYTIAATGTTNNSLVTNPPYGNYNPMPIPIADYPFTAYDTVKSPSAGTYTVTITKLTAGGCENNTPNASAGLLVRPAPTVNFPTDDVCKGGGVTLTFTGSSTATQFILDYRYTKDETSEATNSNQLSDPDGGLISTFNPGTGLDMSNNPDVNGVKTFTHAMPTGEQGRFRFYLHTVSDGVCTNTNPNAPAWKWWE